MENSNPYQIQIGKRITFNLIFKIGIIVIIFTALYLTIYLLKDMSRSIFIAFFVILIALIIIIVAETGWHYLYLESLKFDFQKENLYFSGGIVSKFEQYLPYSRIQHVVVYEGFWQRMMGLSSISIETARELGSGCIIPDLLRVDTIKLREHILSQTKKYKPVAGL